MGVTLHYRGTLDDLGQLPALCDELADIAQDMAQAIESPRFAHLKGQSADEIAAALEQLAREWPARDNPGTPPDTPNER